MNAERRIWIVFFAMKIVLGGIFAFCYMHKLPPAALWIIPLAYVGIGIWALSNGIQSAAAFCGIMLVLLVVVYFAPGPIHEIIQRAMGGQ